MTRRLISVLSKSNELPDGLVFDLNPSVATVTHSSGVVSAVTSAVGGFSLAIDGAGSDVLFDESDGSLQFQAGKYLSTTDATLTGYLDKAEPYTVFGIYETDTSPIAMSTLFSATTDTASRMCIGHRNNDLVFGTWNGAAYVGVQSFDQDAPSKKAIFSYTFDGSSTGAAKLNKKIATGTTTPYTVGNTGFSLGARLNDTLPFDGKIYRWLVFNRVLTATEISKVIDIVCNLQTFNLIGQSNGALWDSIASPYNKDGTSAYIDARNGLSRINITEYNAEATSGSYLSKLAYDAASQTHNNYWVDDTGSPSVAGPLLTAFKSDITSYGYSNDEPFKFIIANLESELFQIYLTNVSKAQVKAALEFLLADLQATYPNASFHYQILGRHNNNFDSSCQTARDIQFEVIASNTRLQYSHDMASLYLQGADSVHYSPTSFATAGQRAARSINANIKGASVESASITGNVITLQINHNQGTAFTNANYLPVPNLMADPHDFTGWTASGCTVTANTDTGANGVSSLADTLDKTSTGTRSIRQTFSTTTGEHFIGIKAKAGTNDHITILAASDAGDVFGAPNGRVEFDLTNITATDRATGGSTLTATGIEDIGANWLWCWLRSDFSSLGASPIIYLYPDVASGIGTVGDIVIDQMQVHKADFKVDFVDGAGEAFLRVFDDGVEVLPTSISSSGNTITITLSSTPADGSIIDIYGMHGDAKELQRHTIPVDNSSYAMPMQAFKQSITA